MNILFNNPISFGARNKRIKKADEIMLKTAKVFPMKSATYIDQFYITKSSKKKELSNYINNNIAYNRAQADYNSSIAKRYYAVVKLSPILPYLREIAVSKFGNCQEHAIAALAILCSNGYVNSERISLYYKTDFINKKTKEIEASYDTKLDHSFVITSMSDNPADKKDIVIDYWLRFADSLSKANEYFYHMYSKQNLKSAEEKNISNFVNSKTHNINDYHLRSYFYYKPLDNFGIEDMKKLGHDVNIWYPN